MSYYESVFIARQDISAPQVETLTDTFAEIIGGGGGRVTKREYWGLRNLAYRIKKNRKGHYMLLNIDAPPDAIQEMERNMRINEDILRYMTIRVEELEDGPSVMARSRSSRDDHRPRRDGHQDDRRGPRRGDRAAKTEKPSEDKPAEDKGGASASDEKASSDDSKQAEVADPDTDAKAAGDVGGDEDEAASKAADEGAAGGGADTETDGDKT